MPDSFKTLDRLTIENKNFEYFSLKKLELAGWDISHLPYSMKILLENLLRSEDGVTITAADIKALASWNPQIHITREIAFTPARTLLQDFTGVPALVDLAAMRDAMANLGGDPTKINPLRPVELVIDHSIQVDEFGSTKAFTANVDYDYQRNSERYALLRWGQQAFANFKVVPPNTGICHQVNLEYLSRLVCIEEKNDSTADSLLFPDTCVGTDSHTPMMNGLGVLGWGVGGIEAEAAMLGQPITMLIPQVVGVKLIGQLKEGTTATDLVLTITEKLRQTGVVGKFVEFFGPGIKALTLADRATIGNMSPEYGATCAIFPPDQVTIDYLKFTGRSEAHVKIVEAYLSAQGLFHDDKIPPKFSEEICVDLETVEPSVAGPKRPQDRIALKNIKTAFDKSLPALIPKIKRDSNTSPNLKNYQLKHGSVVIAAITSCTNTSNPYVMIAAGLVAKKSVERGLRPPPWVKTSLAPGSKVVTSYLEQSGLSKHLDTLGFNLVGYGCTTCIGNSGPLIPEAAQQIRDNNLVGVSVLSGNRNFEGRINPDVRANFLMSPPLVVAFGIKGEVTWDPYNEPIGIGKNGEEVFLKDLWPTQQEIIDTVNTCLKSEMFKKDYENIFEGDYHWKSLEVPSGDLYAWNKDSSYVQKPPYFSEMKTDPPRSVVDIDQARILAILGDSVTTDHISPAGSIKPESPAGKYLTDLGVNQSDFNSYGSRRGNHEVMIRGTFANNRIQNQMTPDIEGGFTIHLPTNQKMTIFEAAQLYQKENVPLCIVAGKEYGSGSSRDWAAKGPFLQGVKFILAESYERIHRSNLIGMGILPLQFVNNENSESLKLSGKEILSVVGLKKLFDEKFKDGREVTIKVQGGSTAEFNALVRIDTPQEVLYYLNGGILQFVLRQLLNGKQKLESLAASMVSRPGTEPHQTHTDHAVHEGSKESFPASDPPAY